MLTHSYTARLGRTLAQAIQTAWQASLFAGAIASLLAFLARVARGSRFLSLASGRSRPLDGESASLTGDLISGSYRWTRQVVGDSPAGRWSRAVTTAVPNSVLAGEWTRPLGAALVGITAARLIRLPADTASTLETIPTLALKITVLMGGVLLVWRGPGLAAAWHSAWVRRVGSFIWRMLAGREGPGAGVPGPRGSEAPGNLVASQPDSATTKLVVVAAVILAGGAAFLAGLAPGTTGLVVPMLAAAALLAGLVVYRPQALLLLLAAFPWLDWAARRSLGGLGAAWDELLLMGASALLVFAAIFTRQVRLRTVPITLPLLVALAAGLASQTFTKVPSDVGLFALRITFQPLLFYYLGYLLPRDVRWVRRFIAVFLVASLLLALHGIFQYLTDAPMPANWVDQHETIETRAYSIILNPNGLGAFLLLGALLCMSLALAPLDRLHRVAMLLLAAVLAAGIAVTFSRGAWIALVVGGFALAALAYRRLFGALVIAALLAPALVPAAFLDRITFAFSERYIALSLRAGRLLMWDISLRHIVAQPLFGVGLGTFGGTTAFVFGFSTVWVDNFYLQLAAEGGLILFAAFMWLLLRVGKGLVATTLDQTDPYLRAVSAGVFAGFVAVLLANFTASVWETVTVAAGFWFLAGLASRPVDEPDERESPL